ncbi:MAG TPA: class I SAM-dependent methyltransferase [Nitrospiria bacterium]|nr:class I SAM-dependent methyltransferase [Nitrospiria bacterium]
MPSKSLLLSLYATSEVRRPWPADRRRLTWARALRCLPGRPGRILDVGANDGHFLSLLPDGWDASALEPVGAMRDELRKRTSTIFEGFIDDRGLGLPEESFDVVCLFDVFEHLLDVRSAVNNIMDCLKPGGLVLIETGTTRCLPARLFKSLWWYYDYIEHLVFFSPSSLAHALASAGIRIEQCQPVVHTDMGGPGLMWKDLAVKLGRVWTWKAKLAVGIDARTEWLEHPFRVYWPDHLFVVGRKPARSCDG